MTLLVTSIAANNVQTVRDLAERAWRGGCDAVELRIDDFRDKPDALADYLRANRNRTWIVTCRSAREGGNCRDDAATRATLLRAVAEGTGAFVDFELSDWDSQPAVRTDLVAASSDGDGEPYRLILSAHDFTGPFDGLARLLETARRVPQAGAVKLVYRARHICESFDALDLLHRDQVDRARPVADTSSRASPAPLVAIAMDDHGLWTRVLAKKFDAFATYCSLEHDAATAPGQPTLAEMVRRYRWSDLDADTKVYGLIGDPVAQSMSPLLHNTWFAAARINAVYLPLRVAGGSDELGRFLDECRARPWLDLGGFSVTTPHKRSALDWLGDGADSMSRGIGATNTLAFSTGGAVGYNTDAYAFVASLLAALGCSRAELSGLAVDILGVGGAARAVAHGLVECGCRMTFYGRSPETTACLAADHQGAARAWDERDGRSGELVINCTSVGMWPDVDGSPLAAASLNGCQLAYDLIYNPLTTRFLREATAAGCKTLNGLDMFIRQAAMQFELWTDRAPETESAYTLLERELSLPQATKA